jgi:hypothetical protein
MQQLALQVAQLGGTVPVPASPQPALETVPEAEEVEDVPEDPVLSRLSGLIDDF